MYTICPPKQLLKNKLLRKNTNLLRMVHMTEKWKYVFDMEFFELLGAANSYCGQTKRENKLLSHLKKKIFSFWKLIIALAFVF